MYLKIDFQLKKNQLPSDYRPVIVSLFKAIISKHYPEQFRAYYETGAQSKAFTFSVLLPKPQFHGETVQLTNHSLRILFSSGEESDLLLFFNAFQKSRGYEHPLPEENSMTVTGVNLAPSPQAVGRQALIRFLSPLVVREHTKGKADRYYIYGEENFDQCLSHVVSRQLGQETADSLTPVRPSKTVVRAFGVKIRPSLGLYVLQAEDPSILNRLAKEGIGSRRNQGFGLFMILQGGEETRG